MDGFKLISKHRKSIMGLAAIFILIFHGWNIRFSNVFILGNIEGFLKTYGYLGVDIFLFLSGYGLYYSMENGKLSTYYAHRITKLFPPAIVIYAAMAIVGKRGLEFFVKAVTGIGFYTESIYYCLWFIPAIITIALLYPFYHYIMKAFKDDVLFTMFALTVWFILTMALKDVMRGDLYGFTDRLPIFMTGVLFASISRQKKVHFNIKTWIFILLLCVTGIYCNHLYTDEGIEFIVPMSGCFIPAVLFSVPFVLLLAGLCELLQTKGPLKSVFKGIDKIFAFFGGFSFELYCVQEFVIGNVRYYLLSGMGVLTANILSLLAAVICGYILFLILNCYKYVGKRH